MQSTLRLILLATLIGCSRGESEDTEILDSSDSGDTEDTTPVPGIAEALDCGTVGSAGGIGAGTDLQRYDFDPDVFPDAVCNDGTPAFFYFRPHEGAGYADRWVIQLQGGGSCGSPADCYERWCSVGTHFGMQGMTADESPLQGIRGRGILDRSRGGDNPMGPFNQVFVRYCSSDTWSGTARDVVITAPHPVSGEDVTARLSFAGAHIVDAVLATLRHDGVDAPVYTLQGGSAPLPDLDDAASVVLAGASGGGAGTIWNADRVGEALRAHNTACQGQSCPLQYRALIDSVFNPDRSTLEFEDTTMCTEKGICSYEAMMTAIREQGSTVLQGSMDEASCVAAHTGSGDLYRCSDNGHVIRNHLTTPIFVRMGQTDSLLSGNFVDAGYGVDGAPVDLSTYARLIREHLLALTDPGNAEEGASMTAAPGVFSPTCSEHEVLSDSPNVFDVTIDEQGTPVAMFDAIQTWLSISDGLAVIATTPSDNVCPP